MRVIVFSDSHRTLDYMFRAIEKERPDAIIHLGDHAGDGEYLGWKYPTLPHLVVRGNCDFGEDLPLTLVTVYEGVKLFLCHGHTLGVKYGMLRAELAAREAGAQVLLYGHTHIPHLEQTPQGLWTINPGAYQNHGYAILDLRQGTVKAELKELF